MGEARYHCKIEFPSKEELNANLGAIVEYLLENAKAYQEWQRIREETKISPRERYESLKRRYWLVFKQLPKTIERNIDEDDIYLNFLGGYLLDGFDWWVKVDDNTIELSAVVWHFDNWDYHKKYFESLGAKVSWYSEEWYEYEKEVI